MDTVTLRVAFGVVAFCVMVLFYAGTYRSTRSAFSVWWALSLLAYLVSAVLFLLDGTPAKFLANPVGNMIAVFGSACVWAAARSLRGRRAPPVWLVVPGVVVLVVSLLDDPAHDTWAGGSLFLVGMWAYYVAATRDLWLLRRDDGETEREASYAASLAWLTVSTAAVAVFYFLRWVTYLLLGPYDLFFQRVFGSGTTTLLLLVLLAVVTFSMSTLAQSQLTRELQDAATYDALTGLLNRAAYETRAQAFMRYARHQQDPGYVVMADLDDLKQLNDRHGHAAGDAALVAFGEACRAALQPGDIAARVGGDEFVLLLPAHPDRSPEDAVREICERLGGAAAHRIGPAPSVSFGIAPIDCTAGLPASLARADAALYRAKAAGSGLAFHDGEAS